MTSGTVGKSEEATVVCWVKSFLFWVVVIQLIQMFL